MKDFIVRGHSLFSLALPGCVLVMHPPLLPSPPASSPVAKLLTAVGKAFSPRLAARTVGLVTWERDVALHASTRNVGAACARVPLHLRLFEKDSNRAMSGMEGKQSRHTDGDGRGAGVRFIVLAELYDPFVFVSADVGSKRVSQLLGLDLAYPSTNDNENCKGKNERPHNDHNSITSTTDNNDEGLRGRYCLYGLSIAAHNTAGLIAACAWISSAEGRELLASPSFQRYVVPATQPTHCTMDQFLLVEQMAGPWQGEYVCIQGHPGKLLCVRHTLPDHRVLLEEIETDTIQGSNSTGKKKKLWRKASDVWSASVPGRFRGLWRRTELQEPRGTIVDAYVEAVSPSPPSAPSSPESTVFWLQTDSWFCDFRDVPSEGYPRAFAGRCRHTRLFDDDDLKGRDILTWTRLMDTRPDRLPSGFDSAVCIPSGDGDTLLEDGGEEYLETWKRVQIAGREGREPTLLNADSDNIRLAFGAVDLEVWREKETVRACYRSSDLSIIKEAHSH